MVCNRLRFQTKQLLDSDDPRMSHPVRLKDYETKILLEDQEDQARYYWSDIECQ